MLKTARGGGEESGDIGDTVVSVAFADTLGGAG